MCSPLGHSLAGAALVPSAQSGQLKNKIWLYVFVFIMADLPDIDFIFGFIKGNPNEFHHQWTHSLFFALLAGVTAGIIYRFFKRPESFRFALFAFFLVISHILLDFFSRDVSFPYGIQLFWPVTTKYYLSPVYLFLDVVRESSKSGFIPSLFCRHNLISVIREGAIFIPLLIFVNLRKKFARK